MTRIISLAAYDPDRESLALALAGLICSEAYAAAKKDDYKTAEYIWTMALNFYPLTSRQRADWRSFTSKWRTMSELSNMQVR